MADRQLDAISVGVGLNLSHVRSDLQRIQGEVRRISTQSQDAVFLPLRLGYRTESGLKPELRKFRRQIEKQLSTDQNNAIHVPIQLRIGKQDIREARRTLEQGFGQNPVHVPIQVANLAAFRTSIEAAFRNAPIEIEVVAKRGGRGGGGGGGGSEPPPASGGRRPTTPPAAPTGGGTAAPPSPVRNAPARGRAQRPAPAVVVPSTMSPAQHAATQPGAAWPVQEPTPTGTSPGAAPSSPRQARRTQQARARQERAQQAATPGTGLSGPTGPRKTNLPPSSGRMSIDELRFAPRQEELQGDDRAAYAGQTRARPTSARGQAEQPGERHTVRGPGGRPVSRIVPGASRGAHRRQEEIAQDARRKARDAWKNSPEYRALPRLPGGELDVASFVGFGDEWKRMYEAATDPEASFTMEDVRDIRRLTSEENRRRFGVEGREGTGKRGARSVRRTRKIRAGRVSTERMSDKQLVEDAALGALGAEVATQVNPLQHVKSGDTKGRGKGGKVGRIGGRGAGQLASEAIDIDAVAAIIERRRIGGPGNGWKTLRDEFDRADISRAQGIIRDRADKPEAEPIVPGMAYGGGAEMYARGEAPSVPGGQGISRDDESPAKRAAETRSRQANREARKREDELPRSGRSPGPRPAPLGQTVRPERATRTAGWEDLVGDRARRPAGAAGTDPRDRTSGAFPGYSAESTGETSFGRNRNNPPRQNMGGGPTARNTGYRYQERGHRAGWESFQREFRGGRGTAERPPIDDRISKLKRMAGQVAQSPHEASIAAEMLRRLRIPGYAEGGVPDLPGIPWAAVRAYTRFQGPAPRPGSRVRAQLEQRYQVGMRNREERSRKPLYQQGGKSDPAWAAARAKQIRSMPWCASCGSTKDLTGDHIVSTASGGTHDPSNLQTLCRSCNSRKAGGKAERPIETPYSRHAPGSDPWGPERSSFEDEMGFDRRAEGGTLWERVQRAKAAQAAGDAGRLMSQGLPERAEQRPGDFDTTIVGERGAEGIVTDRNTGQTHVIPAHKLPTWLQRAQEGRGVAKDMTGRAEGGPLRVTNVGAGGQRYQAGGSFVNEMAARTGAVSRVFVVNWPSGAGFGNINAAAQQAARAHAAAPVAPPLVNAQGQPLVFAGAAGGGAAAQPAPGTGTRTKLSPLQKVEARRAGAASTEDVQMRLDEIRSGISESLQQAPVRALSVAFGQIAQTAIGGRAGILKRAGIARRQLARASKETTALEGLEGTGSERLGELRSLRQQAPSPARDQRIAEIRTELGTQIRPAIQAQRAVVAERADQAAEAQGKILSKGQLVKAQGVGLVGIIAGTQAFTMAIAGLTAAETAAAAALGPLVDEMLGWPAAIDKVTAAVRDNMQTSAGNVTQGLAATFGQTGVSAEYLAAQGGAAGMSGIARAAQQRASQALDLTRAAARPDVATRGLYEGTGGLAGTNIATSVFGGQEGFLQTIVRRLEANRPQPVMGTGEQSGKFFYGNETETGGPQADTIADLNKNLEAAAGYAGDAANAFKLVEHATKEQTDAMVKSAEATGDAGAASRARELQGMGIAVTRGGRNLQDGADFQGYAEAQARGQLIDNPQVLLDQTQNQRRAQAQLIQAQAQAGRQEDIPAQFALGQMGTPLHQFGLGVSTQNLGGPYGKETQANLVKYQKMAEGANKSINTAIDQGRKAMNDIVRRAGPDALREFSGITAQIEQIGQQIKDTQDPLTVRQTAYEAKEYAEQLRLGTRSLGDAKDFFAAIQGATMDTVGGLQGQNALLDRQNQLLGRRAQQLSFKSEDIGFKSSDLQAQLQMLQFAQAQRQINFSKATAGFTAPGDTPEERSARIKQAKIEASEAQKQLNLQRQIFAMSRQQLGIARQQLALNRQMVGNQNRQQDNSWRATFKDAERSVGDLEKQLALLAEGHAISVDTKGVEDAIGRLVKQQDLLNTKAQSYLSEGAEIRGQLLGTAAEVSAATGKAFGLLVRDVNNAWNAAFAGYTVRWAQLVNSINGTQTGGGTGGGSKTKATGGIETVNHATKFVAGEAGTESVIVLRNPQQGFLSMMADGGGGRGGGGVNVNLYVSGNNVSSDRELDALVYRIERKLNQSLGLAGLRNRD